MYEGWDLLSVFASRLNNALQGPGPGSPNILFLLLRNVVHPSDIFLLSFFFIQKMPFSEVRLAFTRSNSFAHALLPSSILVNFFFLIKQQDVSPQRFQFLSNFPKVSRYENVNYLLLPFNAMRVCAAELICGTGFWALRLLNPCFACIVICVYALKF